MLIKLFINNLLEKVKIFGSVEIWLSTKQPFMLSFKKFTPFNAFITGPQIEDFLINKIF